MKNISTIKYFIPSKENDIISFSFKDISVCTERTEKLFNNIDSQDDDIETMEKDIMDMSGGVIVSELPRSEYVICIIIQHEIEHFDAAVDMAMFSRQKYLVVLGILTFITQHNYSVFDSTNSEINRYGEVLPKKCTLYKRNTKIDETEGLERLLNCISKYEESKLSLVFTMIDKWRKGFYLESESIDNYIYYEEAKLNYIQIIELMANEFSCEIEGKSDELIDKFIDEYRKNVLSINNSQNCIISSLVKDVQSLMKKEIHLKQKIIFMLKRIKLYNEKIDDYVSILITERNAIAHGQKTYDNTTFWPLMPYFNNCRHELYSIEILRYFSARIIDIYCCSNIYKEIWTEFEDDCLINKLMAIDYIKHYKDESVSKDSDSEMQIMYGGLNYLILFNRIKIKQCREYFEYILQNNIGEEYWSSNIESLIIFYETNKNAEFDEIIKKILIDIQKEKQMSYTKYRDLAYYIKTLGFSTDKLFMLINDGEII